MARSFDSRTSGYLIYPVLVLCVAAVLGLCNYRGWIFVSTKVFASLAWVVILLSAGYAAKRRSLTAWILIGTVSGAEFGHDWPATAIQCQVLGTIFLRLIKVIIAPLLFGTLVAGIAGHADLRKLGRMGIKALVYFEIVSTLALVIGFAAIQVTRAGVGIQSRASVMNQTLGARPHSTGDLILNIFPENIVRSVSEGQILQVVVFSALFGLALAIVSEPKRLPLLAFAESLSETMFRFTNLVMLLAPLGVFGATAYTVGHMGLGVLLPLIKLLGTMYAALAVFLLIVLLPIALLIRLPLGRFLKAVAEPVTIAFGTASSEAALPRAMEQMEKLGVARETAAFVLPLGYSFNLDGSSLYQSLALVFVAQAAGIHLSFSQQALMALTLLVSSKGTGGVPRASLVIVFAAAASFNLPSEPLFLLFGIDQLMDMARTGVNVLGNCLATVVIASWEGETAPFLRTS